MVDFDDIFRAHYARMVGSLACVAGDREVAADCVQEAFVKAYARWSRISRYDDPVAWVRRVALNKLRDSGRREGRKRKALERLGGRVAEAVGPPGEPPTGLGPLLEPLPPRQRAALALHYGEDLSVAQIARSMGITEGAVKYHLHQGREALRSTLSIREVH
jgi:RNA polymerase sigma-70 factor (ECF subfamily)